MKIYLRFAIAALALNAYACSEKVEPSKEKDKAALAETGQLQDRIVELEKQVGDFKKALEAQGLQVDEVATENQSLSSTVTGQQLEVSILSSDLAALQILQGAHGNTLTVHQVDISDLNSDLSSLQTVQANQGISIGMAITAIAQLQVSDSTKADQLEQLYADIDTTPTLWLYDRNKVRRHKVLSISDSGNSATVELMTKTYVPYRLGIFNTSGYPTQRMEFYVNAPVVFTSSDCTGQPYSYLTGGTPPVLDLPTGVSPGNRFFVQRVSEPTTTAATFSEYDSGTCICASTSLVPKELYPVEVYDVLPYTYPNPLTVGP